MSNSNTLIATVDSDGTVSPGQKHRASPDFKVPVPDGAIDLQWMVTGSVNDDSVTFDVMQDISLFPDSTVAKGLTNGSFTSLTAFGNGEFYIANPSNNPGSPAPAFTVEVYAVFPSA